MKLLLALAALLGRLERLVEILPLLEVLQMAALVDKQTDPVALAAPVAVVTVAALEAAMAVMAVVADTVLAALVKGLPQESLERKAVTSMLAAVLVAAEVQVESYMVEQVALVVVVTVHPQPTDPHM